MIPRDGEPGRIHLTAPMASENVLTIAYSNLAGAIGIRGLGPMGYRSLAQCVRDLESTGQLLVIDQEVDPYLEVAAIQRRVYQAGGPALLFRRVKGTAFPVVGNLF